MIETTWLDKPTHRGWWWIRQGSDFRPQVVEVYPSGDGLRVSGGPFANSRSIADATGWQWYEALPPGPDADRDAADLAAIKAASKRGVKDGCWVVFVVRIGMSEGRGATLAEAVAAALRGRDGG